MSNFKQKRIESTRWTEAAKGQECTFELPDVCSYIPEKIVFCHAPSQGKGMAIKSDDIWGADGCYECHLLIDDMALFQKAGFLKEDSLFFWQRAIHRTLRNRYERGIKW